MPQMWCASDVYHIDLSYWAFEKLAHPTYGVMNVKIRPVDCETHKPLHLSPGHVSKTIYSNTIQPGWSWQPYKDQDTELMRPGAGHDGGPAAFTALLKDGGVSFNCRRCAEGGYQPFNGAGTLAFWVTEHENAWHKFSGMSLKLNLGRVDRNQFCDAAVFLKDYGAKKTMGLHSKYYEIPVSEFECGTLGLNNVESVNFAVLAPVDHDELAFAIDGLEIKGGGPVRGGGGGREGGGGGWRVGARGCTAGGGRSTPASSLSLLPYVAPLCSTTPPTILFPPSQFQNRPQVPASGPMAGRALRRGRDGNNPANAAYGQSKDQPETKSAGK